MQPPSPHDALVRAIFAQPEHAEGELRRLLPPDLTARVDWSTLALRSSSFVEETLRGRHSDLLFSATGAGKTAVLIYLLFEHQSTGDLLMAFRLLRYMVRIWDDFLCINPKATRLPAILPLVLHHSPDGWTSPTELHALLDLDADTISLVAAHVPSFRFLLDDVSAETDEALRARAMTALHYSACRGCSGRARRCARRWSRAQRASAGATATLPRAKKKKKKKKKKRIAKTPDDASPFVASGEGRCPSVAATARRACGASRGRPRGRRREAGRPEDRVGPAFTPRRLGGRQCDDEHYSEGGTRPNIALCIRSSS